MLLHRHLGRQPSPVCRAPPVAPARLARFRTSGAIGQAAVGGPSTASARATVPQQDPHHLGLERHVDRRSDMRVTRPRTTIIAALACVLLTPTAAAGHESTTETNSAARSWVAAWTGSAQGVYPVGYSVGQPGPVGPAGPGNTAPLLTSAFPDN